MAPLTPAPLPLRRPTRGRVFGGVCAGLAAHLGWPVARVRWGMVLAAACFGAGVVFYVWLWVTVPAGDPVEAAVAAQPAALARLAPRLRRQGRELPWRELSIGVGLLAVAALLIAWRAGVDLSRSWYLPVLIALAGLALAWSQLDSVSPANGTSSGAKSHAALRIAGGLALVVAGIVVVFVNRVGQARYVWLSLLAAVIMLAGVALVLAPWALKLLRSQHEEQAARAREAERADIAAHLHDSVLQTLALIRAKSDQPEQVARLARAQERELRAWLYQDRAEPGSSLAAEMQAAVGEIEDSTGAEIGVVVVGDCLPGAAEEQLVRATREALLNATRHGKAPVSLFVEVTGRAVDVYVRDKGDGFDLEAIPADRLGVRESIIGRVTRHGGTARIRTGSGTEIHLSLPRAKEES